MKILFIGDIVGRPGRRALRENLSAIQDEHDVDLTIANVENCAGGFGVLPKLAKQILEMGVDVMTSGNHIWDKKDVLGYIDEQPLLLRPGNFPPGNPGNWKALVESRAGVPVAVLNLQGRVFMAPIDCPFQMAEREIPRLREQTPVVFLDFHAEATSEKEAMGWFLDGQVSCVVGTHTHVATADARVLPGGTAYVTDVGMTGPRDSIIGMKVEPSLARMRTARSHRFSVAKGAVIFNSVVVDIDEESGRARSIHRLDRTSD
ncbi:MAG TPA: TIGR00282 family metallophosphoesterase [Acidobacteriota bacterium]|nr:TIGR00282 family metallophosphoesterase [Acidobacteriota bacterium]